MDALFVVKRQIKIDDLLPIKGRGGVVFVPQVNLTDFSSIPTAHNGLRVVEDHAYPMRIAVGQGTTRAVVAKKIREIGFDMLDAFQKFLCFFVGKIGNDGQQLFA